jgi:hypothetical protein
MPGFLPFTLAKLAAQVAPPRALLKLFSVNMTAGFQHSNHQGCATQGNQMFARGSFRVV